MSAIKCTECGTWPIDPRAKFCPQCGWRVAAAAEPPKPPYGWMIVAGIDAKPQDRYFPALCAYCSAIVPGPGWRLLRENAQEVLPPDFEMTHDGREWINPGWAFHRESFFERMKRDPKILAIRVPCEPVKQPVGAGPIFAKPEFPKPISDLSGLPEDGYVLAYSTEKPYWTHISVGWFHNRAIVTSQYWSYWMPQPPPPVPPLKSAEEVEREAFDTWRDTHVNRGFETLDAFHAGIAHARNQGEGK